MSTTSSPMMPMTFDLPSLFSCAAQSSARTGGHRSVPAGAFQLRFYPRPPYLTRATTAQERRVTCRRLERHIADTVTRGFDALVRPIPGACASRACCLRRVAPPGDELVTASPPLVDDAGTDRQPAAEPISRAVAVRICRADRARESTPSRSASDTYARVVTERSSRPLEARRLRRLEEARTAAPGRRAASSCSTARSRPRATTGTSVQPTITADTGTSPYPFGWVAAADQDGEPWLQARPRRVPAAADDLSSNVGVMNQVAAMFFEITCFGGRRSRSRLVFDRRASDVGLD